MVSSAEASLTDLPVAPVPQEGENRDCYLIGRTLHSGAYTLLKHAVDTRNKQAVALKCTLAAMLHDRVFQAGFARETLIGTTLRSPVIGRVLAPEPGRRSTLFIVMIVMPYYRAQTLENRIGREPRFSTTKIAAIAL
jgi:serine/threonine protein kinase